MDSAVEGVIRNGIRSSLGDGNNTWFWEDQWIGEVKLMDKYPRIYSVSMQKRNPISECGVGDGLKWSWNLI